MRVVPELLASSPHICGLSVGPWHCPVWPIPRCPSFLSIRGGNSGFEYVSTKESCPDIKPRLSVLCMPSYPAQTSALVTVSFMDRNSPTF